MKAKEIFPKVSIKAYSGELKSAPYGEAAGHIVALCGMNADGDVWVNDPYNNDDVRGTRLYDHEEMETVFIRRDGVIIVAEPVEN